AGGSGGGIWGSENSSSAAKRKSLFSKSRHCTAMACGSGSFESVGSRLTSRAVSCYRRCCSVAKRARARAPKVDVSRYGYDPHFFHAIRERAPPFRAFFWLHRFNL